MKCVLSVEKHLNQQSCNCILVFNSDNFLLLVCVALVFLSFFPSRSLLKQTMMVDPRWRLLRLKGRSLKGEFYFQFKSDCKIKTLFTRSLNGFFPPVDGHRQASKRTDYWVPLVICKERWKFSQLLFAGLKMQHMITSAFCVSCCCCCCCLPLPGKKKRKKSFFLYFSIMLKNTTWILCSMQKHFPVYVPAIRKYWMLKSVPVEQA